MWEYWAMNAHHSSEHWCSSKFFNLALQDRFWRLWFAKGTDVPEFLSILAGYEESEDDSTRQAVGTNPASPPEVLEKLASDKSPYVRAYVAANPNTPASVLMNLAQDEEYAVYGAVAANPNTPESVLEVLRESENYVARARVAINPGLTPQFLQALIDNHAPDIRSDLAQNPLIPFELRSTFSNSDDEMVVGGVAKNPDVTPEELLTLSKHVSCYVRRSVAQNSKTPSEALEALASDRESEVREAVARNKQTPPGVLEILSKDKEARGAVASNPNCPEKALVSLRSEGLDLGVARNFGAPAQLLSTLVPDPKANDAEWVRRALAENPNTPLEVLTTLVEDTDDLVLRYIFGNPSSPDSLVELAIVKAIGATLIAKGEALGNSTVEVPKEEQIYYPDCPTSMQTIVEIIQAEINNPKYGMLLIEAADGDDTEEFAAYISIEDKPVQDYSDHELYIVWDMFVEICSLLEVDGDLAFESHEEFEAARKGH